MDQNYFETTGGIKLKIGQIVDYENSNGCITTPIEVSAVPTQPSYSYTSETCTLQLSIGDVNDAPIWSMWSFSVNVEEDVPPRTVIGNEFLQVLDPDNDQITFAITSVACGASACDWFEIGSCDGKLRIKAGSLVKFSPTLPEIVIKVTATDSNGAQAVKDADGVARTHAEIRVTIDNRPEPPVVTGPASFTVNENIEGCYSNPVQIKCRLRAINPDAQDGKILASDPDGSVLTYGTVTTNDQNFHIVNDPSSPATHGGVYIRKKLDYESLPHGIVLQSIVKDIADGFSVEKFYTVNVVNQNDPPFPTCKNGVSVLESETIIVPGTGVIATVEDEDCAGGSCNVVTDCTYAVDATNSPSTSPPFAFSGTTSKLSVTGSLDFETLDEYQLLIITTDKGVALDGVAPLATGTCALTIKILDVNEKPIIATNQRLQVEETAEIGHVLAWPINATDPDNGGRFAGVVPLRTVLTYAISTDDPNDGGKFGDFIFLLLSSFFFCFFFSFRHTRCFADLFC